MKFSSEQHFASFHGESFIWQYPRHGGMSSARLGCLPFRCVCFRPGFYLPFILKHYVIICLGKIDSVTFPLGTLCWLFCQFNVCRWDFVWSFRYPSASLQSQWFLPLFNQTAERHEWNWLMELRVIVDTEKLWDLFDVAQPVPSWCFSVIITNGTPDRPWRTFSLMIHFKNWLRTSLPLGIPC